MPHSDAFSGLMANPFVASSSFSTSNTSTTTNTSSSTATNPPVIIAASSRPGLLFCSTRPTEQNTAVTCKQVVPLAPPPPPDYFDTSTCYGCARCLSASLIHDHQARIQLNTAQHSTKMAPSVSGLSNRDRPFRPPMRNRSPNGGGGGAPLHNRSADLSPNRRYPFANGGIACGGGSSGGGGRPNMSKVGGKGERSSNTSNNPSTSVVNVPMSNGIANSVSGGAPPPLHMSFMGRMGPVIHANPLNQVHYLSPGVHTGVHHPQQQSQHQPPPPPYIQLGSRSSAPCQPTLSRSAFRGGGGGTGGGGHHQSSLIHTHHLQPSNLHATNHGGHYSAAPQSMHHAPSPQPPPPQSIPQIIHPPPDHHAHNLNQASGCGCCGGNGNNGSNSNTNLWQATPITDPSILPTLSLPLMPAYATAEFGQHQIGPTATIFTTSNGYAVSAPVNNNNGSSGNNGPGGNNSNSNSSNHLSPPGQHSNYQQQQQQGQQHQHSPHHHPSCAHHQLYHPSPQTVTEALNSTPTQILDPEETYVCCAYTPRCFLIQKINAKSKPGTAMATASNSCTSSSMQSPEGQANGGGGSSASTLSTPGALSTTSNHSSSTSSSSGTSSAEVVSVLENIKASAKVSNSSGSGGTATTTTYTSISTTKMASKCCGTSPPRLISPPSISVSGSSKGATLNGATHTPSSLLTSDQPSLISSSKPAPATTGHESRMPTKESAPASSAPTTSTAADAAESTTVTVFAPANKHSQPNNDLCHQVKSQGVKSATATANAADAAQTSVKVVKNRSKGIKSCSKWSLDSEDEDEEEEEEVISIIDKGGNRCSSEQLFMREKRTGFVDIEQHQKQQLLPTPVQLTVFTAKTAAVKANAPPLLNGLLTKTAVVTNHHQHQQLTKLISSGGTSTTNTTTTTTTSTTSTMTTAKSSAVNRRSLCDSPIKLDKIFLPAFALAAAMDATELKEQQQAKQQQRISSASSGSSGTNTTIKTNSSSSAKSTGSETTTPSTSLSSVSEQTTPMTHSPSSSASSSVSSGSSDSLAVDLAGASSSAVVILQPEKDDQTVKSEKAKAEAVDQTASASSKGSPTSNDSTDAGSSLDAMTMMPHDHQHHHHQNYDDRHAGNYQTMMGVNEGLLNESMMPDLNISPDNGDNGGGGGGVIATSNDGDIDAHLIPEDARPVTPSPANVQGLPMKELENALRRQLEYYFSSENLAKDTYLLSQMDRDHYVLIEIVANFQLIKNLTNDFDLIVNVLRSSSEVHVDDEGLRVRPLSKRCVVILRDAPEDVKEENIKQMFEMENCPVTLIKCEFVSAGFWYLFFASDEDAQAAFRYLKETLVNYPGTKTPIMARIKAKPIVNQRNKALKAPNVIRPIGIVTAPSPGGSTVSNQSAAVSPVSSISGSVNNSTVLMPNHVTPPSSVINEAVGVAPYSSANTIYSPYPQNVPILPNSRIPQVYGSAYYPPAMIPMPNTSSGCYDLSSIFVTNGLAPHTYPSGVVTSLTPGGVPQTCLSVAPSGPSAHPQQPPQLQFIASSGAGGPALIAANPGPHVSNPGGGRYGSNSNYGNSYYTPHQYNSYPKSHGGGGGRGGGDGGHHRGGSGNSNSGGGQSGKSYRNGGKYSNNNGGYMSGSYHQPHHSNHAPTVYTGYPPQSTVTYHPNPAHNFVVVSNAAIVGNAVEPQPHPPVLVSNGGPVISNNLLTSQQSANSNPISISTPVNQSTSNPSSAISNCVSTNNTAATSSKDTLYAASSSASTELRESREQPQPREREPREQREMQPREPQRPEQREPREYNRELREYTRTTREPRPPKGGIVGGSGQSSGYRNKREGYASNYGQHLATVPTTEVDSSALIRTKPERSGSGKFARNSVPGGTSGGPTGGGGGVPHVPKSSTTVERERTGSATLPAVSRPTRHGHQNSHGAGSAGVSGMAGAGSSGGASGGQSTPEQPFNLLATAFPPLPGMDTTPGDNSGGETNEATATTAASTRASSAIASSTSAVMAVTTNLSNNDAQTTSGGSNASEGGSSSASGMPSTTTPKPHDTSLANVVKGGGHATASTSATASVGPNSHGNASHHHFLATSEDRSANHCHSDHSSQQSYKSSKSSPALAALLPSPPVVASETVSKSANLSAPAKKAALHHKSSTNASNSAEVACNAASTVVTNSNKVVQQSPLTTEGGTPTPAQLSKVMAAEAAASTRNSNSSAAAHNSNTNELPLTVGPKSPAVSNNTSSSVIEGDLVNHHDSSATSNYDYHSHVNHHNNSKHLPHGNQHHHQYPHHNSHQHHNHISGYGGSATTDSPTTRHHTNSVSFVRLSESSLSDFPLDGLPTAPVVETAASGQQSPGSSLSYAQIAQRPKVMGGKLPVSVPQGI